MITISRSLATCYDTLPGQQTRSLRSCGAAATFERTNIFYSYRVLWLLSVVFLSIANCHAQTQPQAPVVRQADSAGSATPEPLAESRQITDGGNGDAPQSTDQPQVEPDAEPQIDPTVDAINQIRRQMGGGVAEQLQGLFEHPDQGRQSLQEDFDERLQQLNSARYRTPLPDHRIVGHRPPGDGFPHRQHHEQQQIRIRAIRQAARQLDETAADLEDYNLYEAADRLRALAAELRQQLR